MNDAPDNVVEQAQETMIVVGVAPNVLAADRQAWESLTSVLSFDPLKAWRLTEICHVWQPADPEQQLEIRVEFKAEFARDDTPTPRSQEEADYEATEKVPEEAS